MSNTTSLGRQAEAKVADVLKSQGYKIRQLNWRTRWCEIDIVAEKAGTAYMVEVKYRISSAQGEPVEFVTPAKLRQMTRAAEAWALLHDYSGDIRLVVAGVSGEDFQIDELIFLD